MKAIVVLCACKADLSESRQVAEADAKKFASSAGLAYFETSAKTGANVNALFHHIAQRLLAAR